MQLSVDQKLGGGFHRRLRNLEKRTYVSPGVGVMTDDDFPSQNNTVMLEIAMVSLAESQSSNNNAI